MLTNSEVVRCLLPAHRRVLQGDEQYLAAAWPRLRRPGDEGTIVSVRRFGDPLRR